MFRLVFRKRNSNCVEIDLLRALSLNGIHKVFDLSIYCAVEIILGH